MEYTISIVRGEQPGVNGVELDNPYPLRAEEDGGESQTVFMDALPQEAQDWITTHGPKWQEEYDDAWVLVTPSDEPRCLQRARDVHRLISTTSSPLGGEASPMTSSTPSAMHE